MGKQQKTETVIEDVLQQAITNGQLSDKDRDIPELAQLFAAHQKLNSLFGQLRDSSALEEDVSQQELPSTISHYEIRRELGVGAFGTVYLGYDTKLERQVAIKVPRRLLPIEREKKRFLREARLAAALHHPNVVSIHEVNDNDGVLYIVSDYVEGLPLDRWLKVNQLTQADAVRLCIKICEAIQHAHESGVIHRDIKPSNIMIDAEISPHVMDFGLAKHLADESISIDGNISGTPAYMSPEQARGENQTVDGFADIYALGVILYELLTGELPFRGSAQTLLHQVIHDEPPSPRKLNRMIPRDLETITLKCLAKARRQRYSSVARLSEDLARWLVGEPIQARPINWMHRGWRWCKRKPVMAALAAIVVLQIFAGIMVSSFLRQRVSGERNEAGSLHSQNEPAIGVHSQRSVVGQWLNDMLDVPIPRLDYRGETPLGEILEFLADHYTTTWGRVTWGEPGNADSEVKNVRMQIWPDTVTLESCGIFLIDEVLVSDIDMEGIPLKAALNLIFSRTEAPSLTYLIRDDVVWITTVEEASWIAEVADIDTELQSQPPHFSSEDAPDPVPTSTVTAVDNPHDSIVTNSIGMSLKLLPAGTFRMGSSSGDRDEKPVHEVTLTQPFFMGIYEVTQEQYERVMQANPSGFNGRTKNPVENVSWNDVVKFCDRLSSLPAEKSSGRVYRLPSEAEWEYACRAGTTTTYNFGEDAADLGSYGWFGDNSGDRLLDVKAILENADKSNPLARLHANNCRPHPVGEKKPNAWGLYDTHGNVWEWCQNWHDHYATGSVNDPTGPGSGSVRTYRGGGWEITAGYCRSAFRSFSPPDNRHNFLGFRVVMIPSGAAGH